MHADHSYDPVLELSEIHRGPLDVFVRPRNVAVIGATDAPGSIGRTLMANLLASPFGGRVFPINLKRATVLGVTAYPRLADIPADVDLAVIATPAATVPAIIDDCVKAGVRGAIIISAGFKEVGTTGAMLETQIRRRLIGSNLRVIGPNCIGVMSPLGGLNATFAVSMMRPGRVGLLSQSGAVLTAILDWGLAENVGFSHVVSLGSMLDVGWGDLIDFLGDDPQTSSIVIYMESIGNARAFFSAAREVALQKPIVVIKAGRSDAASKAAASHTGALTGNDAALEALFRRAGVLRVQKISELFYLADALAKQPRPNGPRLGIVTNAGGAGVLATDALIDSGGELAKLSSDSLESLSAVLPAHWSHGNPVDVLGDAPAERFAKAVAIVANDPQCDGVLATLAPQALIDATGTAQQLIAVKRPHDKPLLASWMGGTQVAPGARLLNQAGIPSLTFPDSAAQVFRYMWQHSYLLKGLYETPSLATVVDGRGQQEVSRLIERSLAAGRVLLTEIESKDVLSAYSIPTVPTAVATSADEALEIAGRIGYPVVLKVHSEAITHKTDVGGVRLDLPDGEAVRRAYSGIQMAVESRAGREAFGGVTVQPMIRRDGYGLIIGSSVDPQLGPVLLFGSGGQLVEVYQDRSLGLPPLTTTLARRMMERTRIFQALQGVRGRRAVDLEALEQLLVRFSQLVVEHPRIREIDINPLLASADQLTALDARIVLHPAECRNEDLPRGLIRPYPRQYQGCWIAHDGRSLTIRPIRPEDEPLLKRFHESLSDATVYSRYSQLMSLGQRTMHERLSRLCFIDYDRQMALVAIDEQSNPPQMVAVARLIKLHAAGAAEFAIVVSDAYQRLGLGTQLMERLIEVGHAEKLDRIVGYVSLENVGLLALCRRLGFQMRQSAGDTRCVVVRDL